MNINIEYITACQTSTHTGALLTTDTEATVTPRSRFDPSIGRPFEHTHTHTHNDDNIHYPHKKTPHVRTQTVRASPHRASCEEGEWQTRGLLASLTVGRRGSADGTCEIVRSERTGRAASGLAACTRHLATAAHVLRREVSILGHVAPVAAGAVDVCLLYTSPSPRDKRQSRMPSSA